jgi:hypothetical protein
LPSLHDAVLFVWTHPVAGLHESSVQPFPSLQLGGTPPTQLPPEQVSFVVQALPSSHDAVLFVWTQPVAGSQVSSVQTFPSSQFGAAPPAQLPPEQVSFVVHALPSSQGAALSVWTHPVAGSHVSSVQTLPSSQFGGTPPTQLPPEHVSFVVQALPSSQGAELFVCTHPVAGLQESSVQPFPSLQFGGAPPTQVPPEQVSFVVQALPSLQEAVLFVWTQPVAGLHESSVQTFPSLQLGGTPPTQLPPEHVSFVVQALPSSHDAVLFVCTHPVAGLQVSSVQRFPSLQLGAAPPAQLPPEQVSFVVHALPSSQDAVLSVCTQPVAGSQVSSVQTLPSSQFGAAPPTQLPPAHVSLVVQAFPSSQDAVLSV